MTLIEDGSFLSIEFVSGEQPIHPSPEAIRRTIDLWRREILMLKVGSMCGRYWERRFRFKFCKRRMERRVKRNGWKLPWGIPWETPLRRRAK